MNTAALNIALVGNPNCGKTALFNRLTGGRQKVANYAGVTVERKEGRFSTPQGRAVRVLDLPGAYSLATNSPDERITREVCTGQHASETQPDLLVCVVDATNLRLNLRFTLEILKLQRPTVLVLNMMDEAKRRGIHIDVPALSQALGIPVLETIAVKKEGVASLLSLLENPVPTPPAPSLNLQEDLHQSVRMLLTKAVKMPAQLRSADDRLDAWVLHPVLGWVLFVTLMFLVFQAVFSWAEPINGLIEAGIAHINTFVQDNLPDGALRSLLTDGVIAGAGGVLVFLPQILILFFFILVLEESGYLPRAAFLLDRIMLGVGLSGRAFIPLLSSFACAIPGIMATRSIPNARDRLATILVAPLMTCSARLPVYALLIGAFIPSQTVWGGFNLQGIVLSGLYFFGILSAMAVAWVFKHWRSNTAEHILIMELPPYRLPNPMDVLLGLWERARIFLMRVAGVIMALTILLWFLCNFPGAPEDATQPAIYYSFAGMLGHAMQPLFAPLGFGWQTCIALVPGMAAREVVVSSLATVYALSGNEEGLSQLIAQEWSLPAALALLAWFVFAPQCISTLAAIKRETNSWRNMVLSTAYLFGLAYLAAFIVHEVADYLW